MTTAVPAKPRKPRKPRRTPYAAFNTPAFSKKVEAMAPGESLTYPGSTEITGRKRERLLSALRSKYYRGAVRRSVIDEKSSNKIIISFVK